MQWANVACALQGRGRAPPREPGRRRAPAGALGGAQAWAVVVRMLAGRGAGRGTLQASGICGEQVPQVCTHPGPRPEGCFAGGGGLPGEGAHPPLGGAESPVPRPRAGEGGAVWRWAEGE